MKVWTVTTDTDDGLSSTVEFTEAAADQAALEIVQDWAERYDLGPDAPDNWRELLHMIQGLDCYDSLVIEGHDISHHPDLKG